ncbi:hypothetical protein DV736_g5947, partial [Chaetothyriales sp. CBS 134916]
MAAGAPNIRCRMVITPRPRFQIIPAVESRIITDLEREEREIVDFVQQDCPDIAIKPAQTTLLIDLNLQTNS